MTLPAGLPSSTSLTAAAAWVRAGPVDHRGDAARRDEVTDLLEGLGGDLGHEGLQGLADQRAEGHGLDHAAHRAEPAAAVAGRLDECSARCEHLPDRRRRVSPAQLEDQVVARGADGEVLLGVVDDLPGAQAAHQVRVPGAADAAHPRTQVLGDLHREGSHAARSTGDEDVLARPEPSCAQALQRGHRGGRHGGGLLEGQALRFDREAAVENGDVRGEGAVA